MKTGPDVLLRELFGGDERYRILLTLYGQPDRALPLRRLASTAQVDPGNASKLLKRLAAAGLCERVDDESRPTFRAPRDHPVTGLLGALLTGAGASTTGNDKRQTRRRYGDQAQRELDEAVSLARLSPKRRGRVLADRFEQLQARANSILGNQAVSPGVFHFKSLTEKKRRDEDLELERAVQHARAAA
ncbi:MAG: MarR family transcriptional regulator [Burkholderiales bacterium]|nr:MarR family transcriptional regulator [Burkholderiales bacterium]